MEMPAMDIIGVFVGMLTLVNAIWIFVMRSVYREIHSLRAEIKELREALVYPRAFNKAGRVS
ncbi:MAG TPA: hypothetical protein DIS79_05845 [Bacteroidetes bacterium]|nr:hypothetical protein [Bacteroidota bacterium]HRK04098.1 hypothetical protein [Chlorobiota bacterium]